MQFVETDAEESLGRDALDDIDQRFWKSGHEVLVGVHLGGEDLQLEVHGRPGDAVGVDVERGTAVAATQVHQAYMLVVDEDFALQIVEAIGEDIGGRRHLAGTQCQVDLLERLRRRRGSLGGVLALRRRAGEILEIQIGRAFGAVLVPALLHRFGHDVAQGVIQKEVAGLELQLNIDAIFPVEGAREIERALAAPAGQVGKTESSGLEDQVAIELGDGRAVGVFQQRGIVCRRSISKSTSESLLRRLFLQEHAAIDVDSAAEARPLDPGSLGGRQGIEQIIIEGDIACIHVDIEG